MNFKAGDRVRHKSDAKVAGTVVSTGMGGRYPLLPSQTELVTVEWDDGYTFPYWAGNLFAANGDLTHPFEPYRSSPDGDCMICGFPRDQHSI